MRAYKVHYFTGDGFQHSNSTEVMAERDPELMGLWKVQRNDGSAMWINCQSPRIINIWALDASDAEVAA